MKQTKVTLLLATALLANLPLVAAETNKPPAELRRNIPEMVEADGKLRLNFGEEILVIPRGLQPSMLRTKTGALVVQAQIPEKPFPTTRMVYPYAMETRVSRDDGKTWNIISLKPDENGLNMEGGAMQLRDGTIIALDTYITPGTKTNEGIGQLYTSTNEWQTLDGPQNVLFDLPNVNFYASKDDGGHPHDAQRLHRRILEMPNGDLLTTFYGQLSTHLWPNVREKVSAALDTHYQYPMPPDHPLWKFPTVIFIPHISGSSLSPNFKQRLWDIFLKNVEHFAQGKPLLNELTAAQLNGV